MNDIGLRPFNVGRMRRQLERGGPSEQPAERDRAGEANALRLLLTEYGNELYDQRLRLLVESGSVLPRLEIAVPLWFSADVVDGSTFLGEPVVRDLIVAPVCRRQAEATGQGWQQRWLVGDRGQQT